MNRQRIPYLFSVFAHSNKPELPRLSVTCRLVNAFTIIPHAELHSVRIEYEIHKDPFGLRMLHRIVHGLLSDAQEIDFHRLVQWPKRTVDFNLRLNRGFMGQPARGLS